MGLTFFSGSNRVRLKKFELRSSRADEVRARVRWGWLKMASGHQAFGLGPRLEASLQLAAGAAVARAC